MIYCSDTLKRINASERKLLTQVGSLLWKARDKLYKDEELKKTVFNCHSICRGLCLHIQDGSIRCVDGLFLGAKISRNGKSATMTNCDHSWLVTRNGNILDPYPVAIMSIAPILLITKGTYKYYGGGRYLHDAEVTKRIETSEVLRKAEVLNKAFKD